VSELANSSCATTTLDIMLTDLALEIGRKLVLRVSIEANFSARTTTT